MTPVEPNVPQSERATTAVLVITLAAMALEIGAGWWTGSMALTADGWHMGMHAVAMGVAVLAYRFARRHRASGRYSFGAGKAIDLGGFANAVMLAVIALMVGFESGERLLRAEPVDYGPALGVAGIGFGVNLLSAWLLRGGHDHAHGHAHGQGHGHRDHNREAAFVHVVADALTSALAILALFGGKVFGIAWLDPLVGLIGAGVILSWALGLARRTSAVLLDAAPDDAVLAGIRAIIADHGDDLVELRAWPVAAGRFALALRVVSDERADYAPLLLALPGIVHATIERRDPAAPPPLRDRPARAHVHDGG